MIHPDGQHSVRRFYFHQHLFTGADESPNPEHGPDAHEVLAKGGSVPEGPLTVSEEHGKFGSSVTSS